MATNKRGNDEELSYWVCCRFWFNHMTMNVTSLIRFQQKIYPSFYRYSPMILIHYTVYAILLPKYRKFASIHFDVTIDLINVTILLKQRLAFFRFPTERNVRYRYWYKENMNLDWVWNHINTIGATVGGVAATATATYGLYRFWRSKYYKDEYFKIVKHSSNSVGLFSEVRLISW